MYIIDGLSLSSQLQPTDTTYLMADYLAAMIRSDGGMRSSFSMDNYWDNTQLAFLVLTLMSGRLHPKYRVAVKRGLQWLADHQSEDGVWYGNYTRDSNTGTYTAQNLERCLDKGQTLPLIALSLYSSFFGDAEFVCDVADKFLLGLDVFIQDNYSNDKQLYASNYTYIDSGGETPALAEVGFGGPEGVWTLSNNYTAVGQAWVYMGLQAAYSLTGNQKYKLLAQQLFTTFGNVFYNPTEQIIQPTSTDTTPSVVTLGFCLWVFGSNIPGAGPCVEKGLTWKTLDGKVQLPGIGQPMSQNGAWLALALRTTGTHEADRKQLLEKIPGTLLKTYPNPIYGHGGVEDTPGNADLPVDVTASSLLAYSEEPSSILWWA